MDSTEKMGTFWENTRLTKRPKELFHRKDQKTGRMSISQVFQNCSIHTMLTDPAPIVSLCNLDPYHSIQQPLVAVATEHLKCGSHN